MLTPSSTSADFKLKLFFASLLFGASISQTFTNIIPTTFLSLPDESSALITFPSHRFLLLGMGREAVSLSAHGSFFATLCCIACLPVYLILLDPSHGVYFWVEELMPVLLLSLVLIMLLTEKGEPFADSLGRGTALSRFTGIGSALMIFILSGLFGWVAFRIPLESPVGVPAQVLFPALAGLFGSSTLLGFLKGYQQVPVQKPSKMEFEKKYLSSIVPGVMGGILVSIMPGATPALGAVIAKEMQLRRDTGRAIVTISGVNTANALFVMVNLFLISRMRSGVALAVNSLLSPGPWNQDTFSLLLLMLAGGVAAATLAYFITLRLGDMVASRVGGSRYRYLAGASLILLIAMAGLFTGPMGLVILLGGTIIGTLPSAFGVRKSHLMGVLLLPMLLRVF
jgi:putative membrane protein